MTAAPTARVHPRSGLLAELLTDPHRVRVPALADLTLPALPALTDPDPLPGVPVPAARDDEPLVCSAHPRVRQLPAYALAGWPDAPADLLLRATVATRLAAAAEALPRGFGLALLDAWRPLSLQARLHAVHAAELDGAAPAYVAVPSADPACPPPHLTGGTVDLTLTWHGTPLALGTGFDAFTPAAHADSHEDIPGAVRDLRRLLHRTMAGQGFVVLACEWWHYELGTRRWAALTGQPAWYGAAHPIPAG